MNGFHRVYIIFIACCIMVIVQSCASLPAFFTYNGVTFYLNQYYECKGGKIYEIQNVMDVDQCSSACIRLRCGAVNVFQLGEYNFMCEILGPVTGMVPAQGAACYAPLM